MNEHFKFNMDATSRKDYTAWSKCYQTYMSKQTPREKLVRRSYITKWTLRKIRERQERATTMSKEERVQLKADIQTNCEPIRESGSEAL